MHFVVPLNGPARGEMSPTSGAGVPHSENGNKGMDVIQSGTKEWCVFPVVMLVAIDLIRYDVTRVSVEGSRSGGSGV